MSAVKKRQTKLQFKQTQNKQIQYLDACFNFINLANFVIITMMRTIIKRYIDNSYGDLRCFNTQFIIATVYTRKSFNSFHTCYNPLSDM